MNSGNNPDTDPANNDTLLGAIKFSFSKMLQQVNGMLPVQVIAYKRTGATPNRVQVQHLISSVTTNGSQVPRPQIASVPALILGNASFMISFPIQAGDLGWILASDRDISLFLQGYTTSPPNTNRMFNFSDGLFIPDTMYNYTINGADTDNLVIQSVDSTVAISLSDTEVNVRSPLSVNVTSPLFQVFGNIQATGTITPMTPP